MATRHVRVLVAFVTLCLAALLYAGCAGGIELFAIPRGIRISPGLTVAAPGEIVNYHLRAYSLVGTEIPIFDEVAVWSVSPGGAVPEGVRVPLGELETRSPGVIDGTGKFEASPVVRPGYYRVGVVRATLIGTWGTYRATAYVVVDGNIAEDAPLAEVLPADLRVPPSASVPYILLCTERESKRVAPVGNATWEVLEGEGTVDERTGVYTAPATAPDKDQREVRIAATLDTGRAALAYLTLDEKPAAQLRDLRLAPGRQLKIGLGRSQRFLAYGTDGDGRFIAVSDAEWTVDGGIGRLTVNPDGTADFLAQAAGRGAIVVARGEKLARQEIIAVIPGAGG